MMQGMDYSVSSSFRCGRGFAGSRGWLQGPGASRGPCQGGGGALPGVPKQQRDRSFQSTWRGEGSGAAKKRRYNAKIARQFGYLTDRKLLDAQAKHLV